MVLKGVERDPLLLPEELYMWSLSNAPELLQMVGQVSFEFVNFPLAQAMPGADFARLFLSSKMRRLLRILCFGSAQLDATPQLSRVPRTAYRKSKMGMENEKKQPGPQQVPGWPKR